MLCFCLRGCRTTIWIVIDFFGIEKYGKEPCAVCQADGPFKRSQTVCISYGSFRIRQFQNGSLTHFWLFQKKRSAIEKTDTFRRILDTKYSFSAYDFFRWILGADRFWQFENTPFLFLIFYMVTSWLFELWQISMLLWHFCKIVWPQKALSDFSDQTNSFSQKTPPAKANGVFCMNFLPEPVNFAFAHFCIPDNSGSKGRRRAPAPRRRNRPRP